MCMDKFTVDFTFYFPHVDSVYYDFMPYANKFVRQKSATHVTIEKQ